MERLPSSWTRRRFGADRWQVAPDCEDLFFDANGFRLAEWIREGRAGVVKDGASCRVYRVELPERVVYVKRRRLTGWNGLARQALQASPARREWNNALELASRGVSTLQTLALGEGPRFGRGGESVLVTQALTGAVPLDVYASETIPALPPPQQAAARRRLAESLGRFCATLHRAGAFHPDLHLGNVLARLGESTGDDVPERAADPELFLIDLPGVQFSHRLASDRCEDSLAMLAACVLDHSSRADRWRFWNAYLDARPDWNLAARREAAARVEYKAEQRNAQTARGRDKRTLRVNRDFQHSRSSQAIVHARRDVSPNLFHA
ncbi:MAG: hypothetical protein N2C14_21915 [Planctomycetales bacterium]